MDASSVSPDSRQIARMLVDPHNPDLVYRRCTGACLWSRTPNVASSARRTAAQHWTKVLYKNPDTGAIDLAFKPGDPNTIYAALWQTRRPPWNVYPPSNGPGSGLYVSHDGGDHWSRDPGSRLPGRARVASASRSRLPLRTGVYALADGPRDQGGLYRSDDGGVDWRRVSPDSRIWGRGWYFCGPTADPKNADRVYVMNTIVLRVGGRRRAFHRAEGRPDG